MPARPDRCEPPRSARPHVVTACLAAAVVLGVVALQAPTVVAGLGGGAPPAAAPTTVVTASATVMRETAGTGSAVATFTPTGFRTSSAQLSVSGELTGTARSVAGVDTRIHQTVTATVTGATTDRSCRTLSLQLGPVQLDVPGVAVDDLDLRIVASGPGDGLGNLPCAVADMLTRGDLAGLATTLNLVLQL